MAKSKPRPTQTKVKHMILQNYLEAWGGIILSGLKGAMIKNGTPPPEVHFVYVDCNAFRGRYDGELEDVKAKRPIVPVYGSPIIGVQALDALISQARRIGIPLRTNAILIEQELRDFEILSQTLADSGYKDRIKIGTDFSALQDQQIAVVNGDSTKLVQPLLQFTQRDNRTYSFFFLDPYGPRGIPLSFVGNIITQPHHDAIINMPYQDLHKKSGLLTKTELSSDQAQRIRDYNAMFGHQQWQELVSQSDMDAVWGKINDEGEFEEAVESPPVDTPHLASARDREIQLMQCYQQSLEGVDPELVIKSIALHFPAAQQTMFYLYLTTHDPTGALTMNRVLWDADLQEQELRWRLRTTLETNRKGFVGTLFDLPPPLSKPRSRTSVEEIAEEVVERLSGQRLPLREIYKAFANTMYFDSEIDRALGILRKAGSAEWAGKSVPGNRTLIYIKRI